MTLVPASSLSASEIHMLGSNVLAAVSRDRTHQLAAVNRSLSIHGESVDELAAPVAVLKIRRHRKSTRRAG